MAPLLPPQLTSGEQAAAGRARHAKLLVGARRRVGGHPRLHRLRRTDRREASFPNVCQQLLLARKAMPMFASTRANRASDSRADIAMICCGEASVLGGKLLNSPCHAGDGCSLLRRAQPRRRAPYPARRAACAREGRQRSVVRSARGGEKRAAGSTHLSAAGTMVAAEQSRAAVRRRCDRRRRHPFRIMHTDACVMSGDNRRRLRAAP